MNSKPLISVITISFNAISTIERTILSVLEQTYSNIEYIIIDGGSTDGSVDIIKKYADKINYWVSEPDNGIYYAMNKGIKAASGDWIHFRNCGDYFCCKNSLDLMFQEKVENDVMLLYGDCRVVGKYETKDRQPPILYRSFKKGMPVFHPSTFVRRDYHLKYLFNTKYKSSSDYEFVYKSMKRNVIMEYRPVVVSIYNSIEGFSISNWKLAIKEEWDWKYPSFPFKKYILQLYLYSLDFRKFIAKIRNR